MYCQRMPDVVLLSRLVDIPITNVTAILIPNITSFGCVVIEFMIMYLNDINASYYNKLYKDILCGSVKSSSNLKIY